VYVQTPSADNMPLSVLEAFASGLPVVSTAVGGVPTVLADRVHGLLAPENDAHGIAARIIELIERPDYAKQLAEAAYEACAQYDWQNVRESWLDVYRRLGHPVHRTSRSVEAA
jgi:L-malate glycosyltransferase